MSSSSLPPQPPQSAAYIQPSNPTSSNPSEEAQSQQLHAHSPSLLNSSTTTEPTTRTVGDISTSRDGVGSEGGGIPTALARGVRGSDADRDREREVEEVMFFFFCVFSFSFLFLPPTGLVNFIIPFRYPSPNKKQTIPPPPPPLPN